MPRGGQLSRLTGTAVRPQATDRASCLAPAGAGPGGAVQQSGEAGSDEALRLAHDPPDKLIDRRDVMDKADDHAATPRAGVHLSVEHDLGVDAGDLLEDVVDSERVALLPFDLQQPGHIRVV